MAESRSPDHRAVLDGLASIEELWRRIDAGDLAGIRDAATAAPALVQSSAAFQMALAASMLAVGKLSDADAAIERFIAMRPHCFEGFELAYRIRHFSPQGPQPEILRPLALRRDMLVAQHLESARLVTGGGWPEILCETIRAPHLSNAFKARVAHFLFAEILTPDEVRALRALLCEWDADAPPDQQLFAAMTLTVHCGALEDGMRKVEELAARNLIAVRDFGAVAYALNLRIGRGDRTAFALRHRFLAGLYAHWCAALAKTLPEGYRRVRERLRVSRKPTRRIAILTPPLVNERHAPTNRVLEFAKSLVLDYGYAVKVFAAGTLHHRQDSAVPVTDFVNLNTRILSSEQMIYEGATIALWGTFLDDGQPWKFATAAAALADYQPDAVLVYGDNSPLQDLLADRLPMLLVPTNSSPPVGPFDRFVSLWDEETLKARVADGSWPAEIADKAVFGAAAVRLPTPTGSSARASLAPGASVLLAIVGTRVADEIRGAFAERLADFLGARAAVHLMVIGDPKRDKVIGTELAAVADRVHCRAFEAELATLMTGCDVMLNPDRQGGGTGVAIAMAAGCPVLSLTHGDAATLLEPADLAVDLDDYFARLAVLVDDPAARAAMAARMPAQIEAAIGFERNMRVLVQSLNALTAAYRPRHDRVE